jgi:hypothetical protein
LKAITIAFEFATCNVNFCFDEDRTRLLVRPLLPDSTLVESQLLALENVAIATTALSRSRRDNSEQTTSLKLLLQNTLNLASGSKTICLLLLHALALLFLTNVDFLSSLLLSPTTQALSVMCFVPLSEWCCVDLDHGTLGQSVGTDEFVVGRMEGDADDTSLAGDSFATPREIAGVETKGAELAVTATSANEMDALCPDTGVRGLTALLERSIKKNPLSETRGFFLRCISGYAHTASYGSVRALRLLRPACGGSRERY